MRPIGFIIILLITALPKCFSQEIWDLKKCVDYAMANNNAVKQSDLQSKIAELTYRQSKLSLYPNFNFAASEAINSGNNQDPTTFTRVTQNYFSLGAQLQSSADVFNFFSKRNTIAANEWELMAAKANVNKIKYDIALSAANAYLQVLLSKEQVNIAAAQIKQTSTQLLRTRKQVDAGALPELNATQLEAQLAADSANYISSGGNVTQSLLSLKSLLNLDAGTQFDIATPPVETIPTETLADLQPEYVYAEALKNQPQQLGNDFRLKAAIKNMEAARARLYPSIGAFAALGTNYLAFQKRPVYDKIVYGFTSTGLVADAGNGIYYDVQSPLFTNGNVIKYIRPASLNTQLRDNFRKSVGININVPIFNGANSQSLYQRSKLNVQQSELQKEQDNLKLKQDIYLAYNSAIVALEKLNAVKKSVAANEKALEFANKRFNIGALSTFDLITTQNNLLRSKLEYSINRFDYIFKMKVLEFYKGAGLKL